VIFIDIAGPNNAAVVTNLASDRRWRFTTVNTPKSGEHPVSGHREFGFFVDNSNGDHVFYTKGADRSTGFLATAGDFITFTGADLLWKSFQDKLASFVNANGGIAAKVARFSQRFKWSVVNIILSPQGSSLALVPMVRPKTGIAQELSVAPIPIDQAKPVKLPAARPATTAERIAIEAAVAVFSGPMFPIVTALRALTDRYNISVAIGPAAGVGFMLGMGAGVGVIFSPGGKIGVYGKFEVNGGILDSIFAGAQLTIVRGGIDEFNEVAFAVGGAFVEGVALNLQVLLSPEHGFRGISFLLGVGLAAEPIEVFLAVEGSLAGEVASTQAAALAGQSFSLNWDDVELIPQPNNFTCWATAAAMAIGWRDQVKMTPESVAVIAGRSTVTGLSPSERRKFATEIGLEYEEPQSYTIDGFRNLLESNGPLWVSVQLPNSGHAILVTGMYSDGAPDGSDTFVRISDPWDRVVGAPGAPGAYLQTHKTGSRYIMTWADFAREYEQRASTAPDGTINAQILHAANTAGRTPSRSGAVGYAMATTAAGRKKHKLPPPPAPIKRAGALSAGVEIASAVAGAVMERIVAGEGSITWELDQLRGLKHPNDTAPNPLAPFRDAPTIRLDQWPYVEAVDGDQISAWFSVDWQYNGTSLGNVRITNVGTNGALLRKLHVSARIMDDNIVYPQNAPTYAALRVRLHYRFTRAIGSDEIAIQDLHLFGDGTFEVSGKWEQ
jgi:hypothetical protein